MRRVVMLSLHTSPVEQAGAGDAGGMNTFIDYLSRALSLDGIEVDLVTASAAGTSQTAVLEDGRRLHTVSAEPDVPLIDQVTALSRAAAASLREVSQVPVDVVHTHYWISGAAGLALAPDLGCPQVHTMHTVAVIKRERDPHLPPDPRREAWEREIADRAAVLTANTSREADDLARLYPTAADRIRLLRPGVDLEVFRPAHPAKRQQDKHRRDEEDQHLEGSPLRLTFAGRLQPHKGPQVAVAAVGVLRQCHPDVPVRLTIVGELSGPLPLDIPVLAGEAGICDILEQIGPLPHERLAAVLRASDAVLMPSYSESFGFVALEAMACGTPVIAHDVGGLAELIDGGRTGVLVDSLRPAHWAAAIGTLLDPDRRAEMGRAAAEAAQAYSWSASAATAGDIYCAARRKTTRTAAAQGIPSPEASRDLQTGS